MKILGLAGKKRSGKDTVAKYLKREYGAKTYAFADPVRKAAAAMFGLPLSVFAGDDSYRENVIPKWGLSPRQMLQVVGTDCGRNVIQQDIWLIRAQDEIDLYSYMSDEELFVITDVRFSNEVEFIHQNGGKVWLVDREVQEKDSHESEQGISKYCVNTIISNNGTLEELYQQVEEAYQCL